MTMFRTSALTASKKRYEILILKMNILLECNVLIRLHIIVN